jgi:methyl-accepting chemotaxis protein
MFKNSSIKMRILGVLALLAGGYLLILGMVQLSSSATHKHMSQISTSVFPAALRMQEAETAFARMQKHYGDAVVLQDTASLKGAEADAEATSTALDQVKSLLAPIPALDQQATAFASQFASLHTREHDTYAAIVGTSGAPSDDLMAQVGALGKENKALSDGMAAFDKTIAANFQAQLDTVDAYSVRTRMGGIALFILAMAACGIAWWIVQFKVVLPLQALAGRMQDIAEGEGDLTQRAVTRGHDEIDEVATWFNVFIERIEQIVRSVVKHAHELDRATSELALAARDTAAHAGQQQEQAARIANTMNQISTAVHEISETTQTAATDARKAEESAHAGGQTTRATVEIIQGVLEANQSTSAKIEELGRSSDAIGKIVHVINDIADQTNLLALNASIEAARAGEHGRGFAVVAGEVRRLAERTGVATKEIDETVRAIQAGTREAVEAMRSGVHHAQGGVDSARSAGESLDSIIKGAESVQQMVTQIAGASTEQSYATQSVNENVNEIAKIIEQTADSSRRSVEACERLSKLASGLTQLMGEFKVSAEDDSGGAGPAGRSASRPAQAVVRPGRLTSNALAAQH